MALLNGNIQSVLKSVIKLDFIKRFKELFLDATVGLVKQYQLKTLDLVKLEAATLYIKGIQIVRRHVIVISAALFLMVVVACALVVIPVMILIIAPWSFPVKLGAALGLALVEIGIPLFFIRRLLSEKKWMEFSKSDELMETLMKSD